MHHHLYSIICNTSAGRITSDKTLANNGIYKQTQSNAHEVFKTRASLHRFMLLSQVARDLLLSMLADDPQQRPSARQVLAHPWMRAQGDGSEPVINDVVRHRIAQLSNLRWVGRWLAGWQLDATCQCML